MPIFNLEPCYTPQIPRVTYADLDPPTAQGRGMSGLSFNKTRSKKPVICCGDFPEAKEIDLKESQDQTVQTLGLQCTDRAHRLDNGLKRDYCSIQILFLGCGLGSIYCVLPAFKARATKSGKGQMTNFLTSPQLKDTSLKGLPKHKFR